MELAEDIGAARPLRGANRERERLDTGDGTSLLDGRRRRHEALRRPDRRRRRHLLDPASARSCRSSGPTARARRRSSTSSPASTSRRSGRVSFDGAGHHRRAARPDHERWASPGRSRTSACSATMTALENVMVGQHARMKAGLFGSILRTPRVRREEKRRPREGRGGARRTSGIARAPARPARDQPLLRRPAPGGDRARAGLRPQAAAARRADRGHEPAGVRRSSRDLMQQAPRRARPGDPAHRARHEGGHGRVRAHHRARPRREDRRGRARRRSATNPQVIEAYLGKQARQERRMPLLEVDDIHTYYGNIEALKGVSLDVEEGECVTLIGSNGAGKSTTLRSISGPHARRAGARSVRRAGDHAHRAAGHRPARDLAVARGPQVLPAHDRAREPRHGRVPAP